MILYLSEPGSVLRKKGGRYVIELNDNKIGEIPAEKLEAVVLFSGAHITSPCMVSLFEMGIPVTWLSSRGKFFGRTELTTHVNIERQREQFRRGEDKEFCLALARKFIKAKIRNSLVLLRRYNRNLDLSTVRNIIDEIQKNINSVDAAPNISVLNGLEGYTSRLYFQALSEMVRDEFKFKGRNRQPPTDPFNSLLSFGYTLLMYEIYTAIINRGLHPYMGFLHRIKRGHPALASDLMEEWRAALVDALVLSHIQRGSVSWEDFDVDTNEGGVYLRKTASRTFIKKFEERLRTKSKYISDIEPVSFRDAIDHQVMLLVKAIEAADPELYKPVLLR